MDVNDLMTLLFVANQAAIKPTCTSFLGRSKFDNHHASFNIKPISVRFGGYSFPPNKLRNFVSVLRNLKFA